MEVDPVEVELDGEIGRPLVEEEFIGHDYVDRVEPSAEWTQTRDDIALNMWNNR